MDKKSFTTLFIILSTLANILLNVLVIFILCLVSCLVLGKVIHVQDGSVYGIVLLACFIVGLFISFIIYTKVSNVIIIKYKMEDKFVERWRGRAGEGLWRRRHAEKSSEESADEESTEDVPRKTNMPSNLVPSEEEIEQAKRWGD